MAVMTVIQEKLLTFGIRKYFTPSTAPGRVTEYMQMITARTTRIGIIILDTRSIPFSTPAKITTRIIATKTRNQISDEKPFVMNPPK